MPKYLSDSKKNIIFASANKNGGIAQLARAPALQAGGRRFDSDYLHKNPFRTASEWVLFLKQIIMPPVDNQYKLRNQEFLQEYAQKPGVNIMFNGVMYRVISKGNGPKPSPKSFVTVHYSGKLINGKVFDQTQKGRPATFRLNELITGWITALREMPAGSRWEIVIPYNLGYGSRPSGPIKAFSTLIFDITLLDVR